MAENVQFPPDARLEDEPRRDIVKVLQTIADDASCIPEGSPFWDSMQSSLMQIDVSGIRVAYRLESPCAVRVIEVQQIPR